MVCLLVIAVFAVVCSRFIGKGVYGLGQSLRSFHVLYSLFSDLHNYQAVMLFVVHSTKGRRDGLAKEGISILPELKLITRHNTSADFLEGLHILSIIFHLLTHSLLCFKKKKSELLC